MKLYKQVLILLLVVAFSLYFYFPIFNFGFTGLPFLLIILTVLWIAFNIKINFPSKASALQKLSFRQSPGKIPFIILAILLIYISIVPAITSWALFRSDDYQKLIGKVEIGENLSKHMTPISVEKITVVDQSLAE